MAILKNTVVTGKLRVTDSVTTDKMQTKIINAPINSNAASFGPGSSGQVLKSNGSSVYWAQDSDSVTGVKGDNESSYRTGDVNLTCDNVGAVSVSQGIANAGKFLMVNSSGNVEATTVATQGAQTITPGQSNKTIASGTYLTGTQTISGDVDLIPDNIKSGVSIFNVTGIYTNATSGTAMTAADLRVGKIGFVNGQQVNGSLPNSSLSMGTTTINGSTVTRGQFGCSAGYTNDIAISPSLFKSSATSGKTYVDISDTTESPTLVSGQYLYIDRGYTDDLKISLAKLIPNNSDIKGHPEYIISGHKGYDNDGTLVTGTIPTLTSSDITVSGATVTIPVAKYTGISTATAITKTIPSGTVAQNAPTINTSTGIVTATVNVSTAGYLAKNSSAASNTLQLSTQSAQTITPTTSAITIPSGQYLTGAQTIKGDANLIASNIKNGVTIFGVTGTHKGYTVTETNDAGGGKIVNITTEGGDPDVYSWIGKNAEFVQTFTAVTGDLGDTTFPSWAASTTATTIKATSNLTTFTADMANYEYVIVWKCTLDIAYNAGATTTAIPKRISFIGTNTLNRRPNSQTNLYAGNFNGAVTTNDTYWIQEYYNTSGSLTIAYSPSYGFYFSAPTPTFASATSNSTTVTVKTPTIAARCSSTYFATTRKTDVDSDNSPYTMQGYLYRINKNGSFRNGMVTELVNLHKTI